MASYSKTPLGVQEIQSPSGDLNPKLRRLLILCNGQTDTDNLVRAFSKDDIQLMLSDLLTAGYIQDGDKNSAPNLAKMKANPSSEDFVQAKNFMINTIGHFHGQYGFLSLKSDLQDSKSSPELRLHYPKWAQCMADVKSFKKLNKDLLKVL